MGESSSTPTSPSKKTVTCSATVILAARIAAKADGGEILVADTCAGLCSGKGFLLAEFGYEDATNITCMHGGWETLLWRFERQTASSGHCACTGCPMARSQRSAKCLRCGTVRRSGSRRLYYPYGPGPHRSGHRPVL